MHDAVRVDLIAENLWPGDGREGRQKAFEVTIARPRRLPDCDAAVIVYDHQARLNAGIVWTDVQALGDHLARGGAAAAGSADASAAVDAALLLYRGACLALTAPSRGPELRRFLYASGWRRRCRAICAVAIPVRRNDASGFCGRPPPIRCW